MAEQNVESVTKIGKEAGLNGEKLEIFVKFCLQLQPHEDVRITSYCEEWANRFAGADWIKAVWGHADSNTENILIAIAPQYFPPKEIANKRNKTMNSIAEIKAAWECSTAARPKKQLGYNSMIDALNHMFKKDSEIYTVIEKMMRDGKNRLEILEAIKKQFPHEAKIDLDIKIDETMESIAKGMPSTGDQRYLGQQIRKQK